MSKGWQQVAIQRGLQPAGQLQLSWKLNKVIQCVHAVWQCVRDSWLCWCDNCCGCCCTAAAKHCTGPSGSAHPPPHPTPGALLPGAIPQVIIGDHEARRLQRLVLQHQLTDAAVLLPQLALQVPAW